MNSPLPKSAQRGFSLIEVLIAVLVMSLGFLALASLQLALIRSAGDAKAQTLAMAIAKQKIDQLAAVQSVGGADGTCVSPTFWVLGKISCYRRIDNEPATNVDGDPVLAGTQALGGVDFRVATTVTRYVFDVSRSVYDLRANTALDSALVTSAPETYLPGKEFKRIVVAVTWTDPTGAPQTLTVENALNAIAPRDSIALLQSGKGAEARKAESIITNPGSVAGVIPIAVGNESTTAASNPAPELMGGKNSSYVAETRFDVYTYVPLTSTTAFARSRVETAVVGCRCDTATKSGSEKSLRPTYWNGVEYVHPKEAVYPPIAGPKAVAGGELPQSDQCRVCCRDHHDPAGSDGRGNLKTEGAKFSPRRATHDHFLIDATTGAPGFADTAQYSEVCRMIRVEGIFRVAADLQNDYFALLPARNTGASAFAPSTVVGDDYADMAKKYLDARITSETDSARYNDSHNGPSPAGPDPATLEIGTRTLADGTTRAYDLDDPANHFLKPTGDSKWLHARGLYIDFLNEEAIAKIEAAKAACPVQPATNDCVLPFLSFTSINLSELSEWEDIAINPGGAASEQVVSVMNNGLKTATGDETYLEPGASGAAASKTISFAAAISSGIVPGMAASGAGVADGARVTTVSNSAVTVDKDNTAAVGPEVIFQGAPVRGLARSGSFPEPGNAADARATASYNNAAIALKFPMNPQETVLTDAQRVEINSSGQPPDPTAGTFTVVGFTDASAAIYPFGTPYPVVEWGIGPLADPFSINPCTTQGAPLPYLCSATSGLGGGQMRIRLSGYNVSVTDPARVESFSESCQKPDGTPVLVTTTAIRPYCKNYDVLSASSAAQPASGSPPYFVSNPGKDAETTEILFTVLDKNDVITIGIGASGETAATFVSCTATDLGVLDAVSWTNPCK